MHASKLMEGRILLIMESLQLLRLCPASCSGGGVLCWSLLDLVLCEGPELHREEVFEPIRTRLFLATCT